MKKEMVREVDKDHEQNDLVEPLHHLVLLCIGQIKASTSPRGNPPGIWLFLKIIVQIPPYPGQNAVQMLHTRVYSGDQMPHPGDISQVHKWQKDGRNVKIFIDTANNSHSL